MLLEIDEEEGEGEGEGEDLGRAWFRSRDRRARIRSMSRCRKLSFHFFLMFYLDFHSHLVHCTGISKNLGNLD